MAGVVAPFVPQTPARAGPGGSCWRGVPLTSVSSRFVPSVFPPWAQPELPAREPPTEHSPRRVRGHGRPARHLLLERGAAGCGGGLREGVLPARARVRQRPGPGRAARGAGVGGTVRRLPAGCEVPAVLLLLGGPHGPFCLGRSMRRCRGVRPAPGKEGELRGPALRYLNDSLGSVPRHCSRAFATSVWRPYQIRPSGGPRTARTEVSSVPHARRQLPRG